MTADNGAGVRDTANEDERAPLLAHSPDARREATPLPRAQLAAVYLIKLTIPIVSFSVIPYINKMVSELDDLPRGHPVGYYSGLVGLAHAAGQFLTVFPWGRVSDWFGRIPIIATGMFGLAASTAFFGLSKTLSQAIFFRFLTGVFSGYVGVIHSVVGELTDASNQSTAFPFYDIISALGFIVGPFLGGTFAEPATQFPGTFDTAFWRAYPYALPGFIAGAIAIAAALLSIFYLRETNPRVAHDKLTHEHPVIYQAITASASVEEIAVEEEKPPTVKSLIALPVIRAICASQWSIGFIASAFNNGFALMAYTSTDFGGLSMDPRRIAVALSIMGLVSIFLKASLPIFLKRFDTLSVYRFSVQAWPLTFALMPILNIIARVSGPERGAAASALLWVSISLVLFASRLGTLAFSIIMILTKDHTPTSSALGTTNSISELAQMIGGSIGAPFIGALFSFSTTTAGSIAGGYLWVVVICVLSLLGDISARRIGRYQHSS
ncbi:MFS general substrate transporter [Trametopsis cervina]|nr:MFS general substrate transporter [Trametopsis cervina]